MNVLFTTVNQIDQLKTLRKENEDGWIIISERVARYFIFVFMQKETEYKYIVYTYDIETECVYIQDEKSGSASDFLFYFCNKHIDERH